MRLTTASQYSLHPDQHHLLISDRSSHANVIVFVSSNTLVNSIVVYTYREESLGSSL